MYDTLLYPYHLSSNTPKVIDWKDRRGSSRVYELVKDNTRYVLSYKTPNNTDSLLELPIRVLTSYTDDTKDNKVVQVITDYKTFHVRPDKKMTFRQKIDADKIVHKLPDAWTLWKIIHHAGKYSRINIRVSGPTEWGKTSYADADKELDPYTKVIPKPRSVPALSRGITDKGVLILDEMGRLPTEAKDMIQTFLFQLGQLSNDFVTGTLGSTAYKTKDRYDTDNLSVINLYNNIEYYPKKEDFFDYAFANSYAINTRYFPLRLPGMKIGMKPSRYKKEMGSMLDSMQFHGGSLLSLDTDVVSFYHNIMNTDEYYRQNWRKEVDNEFVVSRCEKIEEITGRHLDSFMNICYFIRMYSESDTEFDKYFSMLLDWNREYYKALDAASQEQPEIPEVFQEFVTEEVVRE